MKDGIVAVDQALLKLRRQGFKPNRDIIVFFTGDEETSGNGADLGATEWRKLTDAEFGLNADGGGGGLRPRRPAAGLRHPDRREDLSRPIILRRATLAATVRGRAPTMRSTASPMRSKRLQAYRFTPMLNDTTRGYFTGARAEGEERARRRHAAWLANPQDGAGRRRHRGQPNRGRPAPAPAASPPCLSPAMPTTRCRSRRTATVNCRILPGIDPKTVQAELKQRRRTRSRGGRPIPTSSAPRRQLAAAARRVRRLHQRRSSASTARTCTSSRRWRPGPATAASSGPPESRSTTSTAAGGSPRRRARARPRRAHSGPGAVRRRRPLGDDAARSRRELAQAAVSAPLPAPRPRGRGP